ncbi:hypothetical protein L1987_65264 [Smallanthus sonchifolius]|uniref:Uncharacterized protein n=1 Tax=Smallanthus sonchifolius TaxID=185202 RepID=A0ACB9BTU4_9ASTR|nr:hypothetical protein L1987_65264 [Smallanthus sonchifolius]
MDIFNTFSEYTTTKDLWVALCTRFEGNAKVRESKRDPIKKQYEMFSSVRGESMSDMINHFSSIVSRMNVMGVEYPTVELNKKVLDVLPEEWNMYCIMIKKTENPSVLSQQEVYIILESCEIEIKKGAVTPTNQSENTTLIAGTSSSSSSYFQTDVPPSTAIQSTSSSAPQKNIAMIPDEYVPIMIAFMSCYDALISGNLTPISFQPEDLEQINPDDLEKMGIDWCIAVLTLRTKRFIKRMETARSLHPRISMRRKLPLESKLLILPRPAHLQAPQLLKGIDGLGYNSHPPPYSKLGRFADMSVVHVPTPFMCTLSADNYITSLDSDSFASCEESNCVDSKDECDENSLSRAILNELVSDECNNMFVSKPDICEHVENLYFDSMPSEHVGLGNDISKYKDALPFIPKSLNVVPCVTKFKSAEIIVNDVPRETMSNMEFFRVNEEKSLQDKVIEERIISCSDASTSHSSSSCDDNYQSKASCDKFCFSCGASNHDDSDYDSHEMPYFDMKSLDSIGLGQNV